MEAKFQQILLFREGSVELFHFVYLVLLVLRVTLGKIGGQIPW